MRLTSSASSCIAGVPSALEGTDRRPQISISTRSRQLACVYFRKLAAIDQSEPGGPYQWLRRSSPCLSRSFSSSPFSLPLSSSPASQFSCERPQENSDPRPRAVLPLSYSFAPPSCSARLPLLPVFEDLCGEPVLFAGGG